MYLDGLQTEVDGWRRRRETAAARMKVLRQRERNGRAIVTVEIDIKPVSQYLVDTELLQIAHLEDRQAIAVAIQKLLNLLIAADRA
jgi:hypothetical protein